MWYQNKGTIILYMIGGVATSLMLDPWLKGKEGLSVSASIGIGVAAVGLIAWNAMMYRKAAVQRDPEFPVSAFERYTRPVAASGSFAAGFIVALL